MWTVQGDNEYLPVLKPSVSPSGYQRLLHGSNLDGSHGMFKIITKVMALTTTLMFGNTKCTVAQDRYYKQEWDGWWT